MVDYEKPVRPVVGRDPYLGILASAVDDYEKLRIAQENRIRQLTTSEPDEDGIVRGLGRSTDLPEVRKMLSLAQKLRFLEEQHIKMLQKQIRTSPIYPWIKSAKGVGDKQAARLLAIIGDPYWHEAEDRPRTVSELWAYCGYSVIDGEGQRRKKGQKSNFSSDAKMRAYLIANSVIKQDGSLRDIYDLERERNEGALVNGVPITKGHAHNRAMRRVAKEVLKGMWIASRDVAHGLDCPTID